MLSSRQCRGQAGYASLSKSDGTSAGAAPPDPGKHEETSSCSSGAVLGCRHYEQGGSAPNNAASAPSDPVGSSSSGAMERWSNERMHITVQEHPGQLLQVGSLLGIWTGWGVLLG